MALQFIGLRLSWRYLARGHTAAGFHLGKVTRQAGAGTHR
jgi:hypothetical protein